jgi:YidC/Oxa1 family membrane protein insertase
MALVIESGLFEKGTSTGELILLQNTAAEENQSPAEEPSESSQLTAPAFAGYTADNAMNKLITLGATDPAFENPETGFKFQLELSSKGAAVKRVIFSNGDGKGFHDRDYKDPQPLVLLSPIGEDIFSFASKEFVFVDQRLQLALNGLDWKAAAVEKAADGSQAVSFEAVIKELGSGDDVIKVTKTYKAVPESYMVDCQLKIENLAGKPQQVRFNMAGPVGIGREGTRADMRKAVGGFLDSKGQVVTQRLDLRKFEGKQTFDEKPIEKDSDKFLWAAITSKYFAAIIVPQPQAGGDIANWITGKDARLYNPDSKKGTGDEQLGINLKSGGIQLGAAGDSTAAKSYGFKIYLGPKDNKLFVKNEEYKRLGFIQTIDFLTCCCPAKVIAPLAFGIIGAMEWMYAFIPNYGLVIIIIVFFIRLCLHPVTKKSQISMSKMQKLGPMVAELKKKYANNKAELHKHTMELYREQGVSPMTSMLPMMLQMPIWISLYSAIYASMSLRGAEFLPVWITDLSAPDALIRFTAFTLPILGKIESFNLLPIMMGVAFFLQQKLTPKPSQAAMDPQIAQQQKMMMIMMPLLFPLMLYKAPSGLNLYIMASTFAGVVEQFIIRKHIREKEEAESKGLVAVTKKTGGKVKKKKPKPFYKNM